MSEKCPLDNATPTELHDIHVSELPPRCAVCLGRTAAKFGINRSSEELGIRVDNGAKRLMQKGLQGQFYPVIGRSINGHIECQRKPVPLSLNDAEYGSPVIERRKLHTQNEEEAIAAWNRTFRQVKADRKESAEYIKMYANNDFLVEELVALLAHDFIERLAETNLRLVANIMRSPERFFRVFTEEDREIDIMKEVWFDICNDESGKVRPIIEEIITARKQLPRRLKHQYPLPLSERVTQRRRHELTLGAQVIDLTEARNRRRNISDKN